MAYPNDFIFSCTEKNSLTLRSTVRVSCSGTPPKLGANFSPFVVLFSIFKITRCNIHYKYFKKFSVLYFPITYQGHLNRSSTFDFFSYASIVFLRNSLENCLRIFENIFNHQNSNYIIFRAKTIC